MATFKVGQRVKVIAAHHSKRASLLVGREATIIPKQGTGAKRYSAMVDGFDGRDYGHTFPSVSFDEHELAPLTDPKADAFIEAVKSWKPEPVVPLPVKERA